MRAMQRPDEYPVRTAPAITVHALKENRRLIGFAAWPEDPKPKPRPRRKKSGKDTP